jgi:aspartate racemase
VFSSPAVVLFRRRRRGDDGGTAGLSSERLRALQAGVTTMKRIGVVGGIGPESTIEYYRLFMAEHHRALTIDSVDVNKLLSWMRQGELDSVADYLVDAVRRLAGGGAEVAIIAANTPHIVFDAVSARAPIPMVSIVEATASHVAALGLQRVALLGTRYTMEGRFYPDVFSRRGLALVIPPEPDMALVHDRYLNELLKNVFSNETRDALLGVVDRLIATERVEAVILGGTELPLVLKGERHGGAVLIDTTRVHVKAALEYARAHDPQPS